MQPRHGRLRGLRGGWYIARSADVDSRSLWRLMRPFAADDRVPMPQRVSDWWTSMPCVLKRGGQALGVVGWQSFLCAQRGHRLRGPAGHPGAQTSSLRGAC